MLMTLCDIIRFDICRIVGTLMFNVYSCKDISSIYIISVFIYIRYELSFNLVYIQLAYPSGGSDCKWNDRER